MENEILLETEELLQRLVEAVEKLNSAPSEDTIIAFFALVAAWITIAFLLVERHEKNRPYLQISFELVRSTLACIVLRNTGSCPLEIKSLEYSKYRLRALWMRELAFKFLNLNIFEHYDMNKNLLYKYESKE